MNDYYKINTIRNRNKELHIQVAPHAYDFELEVNKYDGHRICFYLRNADHKFVDSFDIDYFNGKIRFSGSNKHYSVSKVPSYIKKLWRCNDFKSMILDELDKAISLRKEHGLMYKEHSLMYNLHVDTKLAIIDKSN
jgi:hypothetical protein